MSHDVQALESPTWGAPWQKRLGALLLGLVVAFLLLASTPVSAQASPPPWATGQSKPEDLVVKLVTFSPGNPIPAWFGHSAIVVEDTGRRVSRLYNYGMFSFDADMLAKFAMGRLWFWVGEAPVGRTYDFYASDNRDVRTAILNLPPAGRAKLAERLAQSVLPENRDYLYHHYFDNCATRPRDVIDEALEGQFKQAMLKTPARMSLRDHTRRHSGHLPTMDLLLMFLMNSSIDRPIAAWDEMFLPAELERQVLAFQYKGEDGQKVPLVLDQEIVFESTRTPTPVQPPPFLNQALMAGIVLGLLAMGLGLWEDRRPGTLPRLLFGMYQAGLGLLLGLPGTALCVMALVTDHEVTFWNYNLLLANPLTLLAAPLGLVYAFGSLRARRILERTWPILAMTALAGLFLYFTSLGAQVLYQDNALLLALILPVNFGMALGIRWWRKSAAIAAQTPEQTVASNAPSAPREDAAI